MRRLIAIARRLYAAEIAVLDRVRDAVFLVLRLYFGYKLVLSGQGKLANPDETTAYFRDLEIPLPELNVVMAGLSELLGGLFLAVGLASRVAAFPVIGTMLVAYLTAHKEQWEALFTNTPLFFKAPPFAYLFTAVMVLVCGPGRFSADHLIGWLTGWAKPSPTAPAETPSPAPVTVATA
jgi:putative oxidoreductase